MSLDDQSIENQLEIGRLQRKIVDLRHAPEKREEEKSPNEKTASKDFCEPRLKKPPAADRNIIKY